jgi:hypothetical protein
MVSSEVIVHSGVSLDSVSRQYLLSIFSMQTRVWPDGHSVRVYILPPHKSEHQMFVKTELKLFPYQLVKIWDRSVFSGAGQSPMVVESFEEMLDKVSRNKGAIGYISRDMEVSSDVKTLHVE